MGRVCVKTQGPLENTTYLGVVDIDGTLHVGIRGESKVLGAESPTPRPLTLVLDDGKKAALHMWYPGVSPGDISHQESGYDPSDSDLLYQMAGRIYGDCKEWTIDAAMLKPPEGMTFGGGMMKAAGIEGVE